MSNCACYALSYSTEYLVGYNSIALFTVTNMATNYVLMLIIYSPFGQEYFMDSQVICWRIKYIFKTLKTHAVYQSMCNSYNIFE